jgi:pimeloyl-ACP methyl ester carboxylesterase
MTDRPAPDAPTPSADQQPRRSRRLSVPLMGTIVVTALVAGLVAGVLSARSEDSSPELVWTPAEGGIEKTTLTVPADHDRPDGPSLELQVLRRPADDPAARIGSLVVNPGGPGFGSEVMVLGAGDYFSTEVLDRFDIVGLDPRGTGRSTPAIDCIDDYDAWFAASDLTPDDETARQAQISETDAFGLACVERTGEVIASMTTESTARDIELLRQALGEDTINYFGASYGCRLGATWVTLFPETVRAAVLDGCEDPTADYVEASRQQAQGFQQSMDAFLATCAEVGDACPIAGDGNPAAAVDALWASVAEGDLPGLPGRPAVNEAMLQTAIVTSMYSEDLWPALAEGIALGLAGDGSILMQLADVYTQRREDGTWGNELDASSVIQCMDITRTPTVEERTALDVERSTLAPLIFPAGYFSPWLCDGLPPADRPPIAITGSGAPPLLVIGVTGDPATPYVATERMAEALPSSTLVTVESNDHGGYGTNACIDDVVDRYLVDRTTPPSGTRC